MNNRLISIGSWIVTLWIAKTFLQSLPYKFTLHPDTQHIFGTIGAWMSDTIHVGLGQWFGAQGSYVVGFAELVVSIILLMPALLWLINKLNIRATNPNRACWHALGGLLASCVMAGAVFFHLFTPLGVEVLHQGKSDGGSLFYAATSILVLGIIMAVVNFQLLRQQND